MGDLTVEKNGITVNRRKMSIPKMLGVIGVAVGIMVAVFTTWSSLSAQISSDAEKHMQEQMELKQADAIEAQKRESLEALIMAELKNISSSLTKLERKIDRGGQ
jgi:Tfp pilus assembly protein PilO